MKLGLLVEQYIDYRKSLGEKFRTNAVCLKSFYRFIGEELELNNVNNDLVNKFLYGGGVITTGWFVKHTALEGFYCYAISRGYIDTSPLPKILPKRPPGLVPYIYSRQELKCLFKAALTYQKNRSITDPHAVQTILFLLYATGMRVSEALSLTLGDIDLQERIIVVRETKFYKKRLIPFNTQLLVVLEKYLNRRMANNDEQQVGSPMFVTLKGVAMNPYTVRETFQRIREQSGIKRSDGAYFQPRLHDLRHTFAVHRLTSWYKQGKDVQKLLPILSTYMGHTYLAATSVYLSMTKELLNEANSRFEQYAMEGQQ